MSIKAIDTYYNGNYFRSRLEARWAVFFDLLKLQYKYEPEGYVLDTGECYLPDFYFPTLDCYGEVKPDDCQPYLIRQEIKYCPKLNCKEYREANWNAVLYHKDFHKWDMFSYHKGLLVFFGSPHVGPYFDIQPVDRGLVAFFHSTEIEGGWYLREVRRYQLLISPDIDEHIIAANKKRFEHKY